MNLALHNQVASRWARLGVMINAPEATQVPDLERLLLDTARVAGWNSRLFILAVSWLALYGEYADTRRLARLIADELEPEHRPTLGFLLECAQNKSSLDMDQFSASIDACGHAIDARPLVEVERQNEKLALLTAKCASLLSLKWGRWMSDFELKLDALRPAEWISRRNPSLAGRVCEKSSGACVPPPASIMQQE